MNLTFQNKTFEAEFLKRGLQNNCYKSWYFYEFLYGNQSRTAKLS